MSSGGTNRSSSSSAAAPGDGDGGKAAGSRFSLPTNGHAARESRRQQQQQQEEERKDKRAGEQGDRGKEAKREEAPLPPRKGKGNVIMRALRKLTPPKMSLSRSSPATTTGNEDDNRTTTSSPNGHEKRKKGAPPAAGNSFGPFSSGNGMSETDSSNDKDHDNSGSNNSGSGSTVESVESPPEFFCPALNCHQKLRMQDVVPHAQDEHSLVVSDSPDCHSNSIEVSESDMSGDEGSAAWAPTLLSAFGTSFFFETWRNAHGKWFMWVYHLGHEAQSGDFVADLEVHRGPTRLLHSGPVHSLATSQVKITTSGDCLRFCDGLARFMLQTLEDGVVTGICYNVRVRRTEADVTKF